MFTSEPSLIKGFKKLAKENKFVHAYLFFGWDPVGLLRLARELANFLENQEWIEPKRPLLDALFLQPDDCHLMKNFLWQKPVQSLRKTVVVQDAHTLSAHAQNAILKIVEEPPASALVILLVKDPELLMPTLASRCQKIYIFNANLPIDSDVKSRADGGNNTKGREAAREFRKAPPARRREIIKEVIEDDGILQDFITVLIKDLSRDKLKNWRVLKDLLHRWSLINRYNVNKKLQLEAALMSWNGLH